jgi:hypothetical protein
MGGLECAVHAKQLRRNGSLDFAPFKSIERKPFIAAAAKVLREDAPALSSMQQLLDTCRRDYLCAQGDVLRRGWTSKQKAKAILAHISKQRGDHASLLVLSAFLGTASMPMPTSSPRFLQCQCSKAVYRLLRSDLVIDPLTGAETGRRISLQGWNLAAALYETIDAIAWPLRRKRG